MTWTFGRRLAVGFIAAIAAIVTVAAFGYENATKLVENDRAVAHTYLLRIQTAKLLKLLLDAETGQRGFVITGDERFLEPYERAVRDLHADFDELRATASQDPAERRRIDDLAPSVEGKLAELKMVIDLRREKGLDAAAPVVAAGKGKEDMDRVRALVDEIDRSENALLEERRLAAEAQASATRAVLLWGAIGGAVFAALVGTFLARSVSEQIASAVRHIQSSSSELQAAANQQATGAKEQSTAMNEITTTISELLATSRQIAESSQRVAQVAERMSTTTRAGDGTVDRGQEAMLSIRRQVDLIVTSMVELGKKSQQIGAVLDILSELAEQTNILAINATIEATGAGESGRRFSVVADEIRKLADRVGASTKEVRVLIDDVRTAVNLTVMTTETGSKAVDLGAKQFGDVTSSYKQIAAHASATTEAAREIELSTKQQATAVEQVNVAITSVAQATKESEVSTGQTVQTAKELTALSRDLLRIVRPATDVQERHLPR